MPHYTLQPTVYGSPWAGKEKWYTWVWNDSNTQMEEVMVQGRLKRGQTMKDEEERWVWQLLMNTEK